jgi:ankyrin repeat protein
LGSADLVTVLLKQGARAGDADSEGNTALHYAAAYGNIAAVTALVQYGGSCRTPNKEGVTALQCAALRGWQHIVMYMVENTYHKFVEVGATIKV